MTLVQLVTGKHLAIFYAFCLKNTATCDHLSKPIYAQKCNFWFN